MGPLFCRCEGRIDEAFGEVEFTTCEQVLGQSSEDRGDNALAIPGLEAVVARGLGRKSLGHLVPLGTGFEHPEDALKDLAIAAPGATSSVGAFRGLGDQRLNQSPLCVGQFHEQQRLVYCCAKLRFFG